jgi:beta-lactam-binding protein with PASTA domain
MSHDIVNPAVWNTMADYLRGKPKVQFKKPGSSKISIGDQRSIPDVTCATIASAKNRIENAGFTASIGQEVESNCPKGTAAGTSPGGRTIKGGYVSIEISKGKDDEPKEPNKPKPPRRR